MYISIFVQQVVYALHINFLPVVYNQARELHLLVCDETKQLLSVTRALTLTLGLGVYHVDGTLEPQKRKVWLCWAK